MSADLLYHTSRWYTTSEAIFLSSITRLFFMSLTLIWPEGLTSHTLELHNFQPLAKYGSVKLNTESILLASLELINRTVAFSGEDDFLSFSPQAPLACLLYRVIPVHFTPVTCVLISIRCHVLSNVAGWYTSLDYNSPGLVAPHAHSDYGGRSLPEEAWLLRRCPSSTKRISLATVSPLPVECTASYAYSSSL